jgi:hypothetical protein
MINTIKKRIYIYFKYYKYLLFKLGPKMITDIHNCHNEIKHNQSVLGIPIAISLESLSAESNRSESPDPRIPNPQDQIYNSKQQVLRFSENHGLQPPSPLTLNTTNDQEKQKDEDTDKNPNKDDNIQDSESKKKMWEERYRVFKRIKDAPKIMELRREQEKLKKEQFIREMKQITNDEKLLKSLGTI